MRKKVETSPETTSVTSETTEKQDMKEPVTAKKKAVKRSIKHSIGVETPVIEKDTVTLKKLGDVEPELAKTVIRGIISDAVKEYRWRVSAEFTYAITDPIGKKKPLIKTRRTCMIENRDATSSAFCPTKEGVGGLTPWFLRNIPMIGDEVYATVYRYDGTGAKESISFRVIDRRFLCSEEVDASNQTAITFDQKIELTLMDVRLLTRPAKFKAWINRFFKK